MGRVATGAKAFVACAAAAVALSIAGGWRDPVVVVVAPPGRDAAPVTERSAAGGHAAATPQDAIAAPAGPTATPSAPGPPVAAASPAPTPTPAPVVVPPATGPSSGATSIEERGRAALALLPFDVGRTGYRVSFEGQRDGYLGITSTTQKTITVYIRPSQTTREIAKVIAHEVGHAIDVDFTTDTERAIYRHVRGIDGRSWYPDCSGCTDYDSVAGDFAETFAVAMVGDVEFLSTVAPLPTPVQVQALAAVFAI